ncbi:MAG TPA: hypothetical protein PKV43_04875, partial [Armatimonadota bacterium]|nr:hypothetical protein [Armatimonadota bacterium]
MPTVQEDRILQRGRMKALAVICLVLFSILLFRLWYLQVAIGSELLAESEVNRRRLIRVRAPRGLILDRKGRVLATSRPQFVVLAIPEVIKANPKAHRTLCSILG